MFKASTILLCALCAAGLKIGSTQAVVGEYIDVNGREMFVGSDWVGATLAAEECTAIGKKLVSFDDLTKYLDLLAVLRNKEDYAYHFFWTSGSRRAAETMWYWNDAGFVTGTFWAFRQPDVSQDQTACLKFTVEPNSDALWYDETCDEYIRFVCE
ncbi:uncharacterized protein LOC135942492 [Cloeon dipterum]|uniref:uncharacterized protein LOC135942492 n=1 Tax=Cloeon dipterum TaxID=197152 RepID=UPI0032204B3B